MCELHQRFLAQRFLQQLLRSVRHRLDVLHRCNGVVLLYTFCKCSTEKLSVGQDLSVIIDV